MVSIVLVEDIVGSTPLRASIGEDEANRLFRAHEGIVSEVVRTFDGDVVKGTGDGVLAIFRSASSAAEAAVTMSSTVGRALGDRGVAVRVGLAVGEIVVLDGDVQGMPVVRATRLCDAAVDHSILAEAAVVMLAGSRIDSLTGVSLDLDLKGIDDPVAAVELIGSSEPQPSALPVLLQAEGPVVGRDDEQGELLARWNEVRSGRAQLVMVSGEAGIGKTSLVADVAARIQGGQGAMVLAGGVDRGSSHPYQPFVEALRWHVVTARPASAAESLGPGATVLAELVPDLETAASVAETSLQSDPALAQFMLFEAVRSWLETLASRSPTMLVIDDVHWMSGPAADMLVHALAGCATLPLLVVVTKRADTSARDDFESVVAALRRRRVPVSRVDLVGLRSDAIAQLMLTEGSLAGRLDRSAIAETVARETGGNPLLVSAAVAHLATSDELDRLADPGVSLSELGIPTGVRSLVAAQLARLSDSTIEVLVAASVSDAPVEVPDLAAVSGLPADELLDALQGAESVGLIQSVAGPVLSIRFTHSLVRGAVYESVSPLRHAALHRALAEVLEARRSEDEAVSAADLARQYAKAIARPEVDKAVYYAREAAREATEGLALGEAVVWMQKARDLLATSGNAAGDTWVRVLIELGQAQWRAGDVQHHRVLLEAAEFAASLPARQLLVDALLAVPVAWSSNLHAGSKTRVRFLESLVGEPDLTEVERSGLLVHLAAERMALGGSPADVLELSDRALDLAHRSGDRRAVSSVRIERQSILMHIPDRLDERVRSARDLVAVAQDFGDRSGELWAYAGLVTACGDAGLISDVDEALAAHTRGANDLGFPRHVWFNRMLRSSRACVAGGFDEAFALADDALALGDTEYEAEAWFVHAAQQMATHLAAGTADQVIDLAMLCTERLDPRVPLQGLAAQLMLSAGHVDAASRVYVGLNEMRDGNAHFWQKGNLNTLGAVGAALGDRKFTPGLYRALLPMAGQFHNFAAWSTMHDHALGALASVLDRPDDADRFMERAVNGHRAVGAPEFEVRSLVEWSRARFRPGDRRRGEELRSEALRLGTDHGYQQHITAAEALPTGG
jgi:hypothetical protein